MPRIRSFQDLGCLVTGASAGIGREIARELARRRARLAITARRRDRLEALAEELTTLGAPAVHVLVADLAEEGAAHRLADDAAEALGDVDVLVNNAGFAVPGAFVRADLDRTLSMLRVNVEASVVLMRLLLPGMVERRRGGVLTLASVAAFQAAPYQAGYAGTKSFLLNLSESVHQEVKGAGVSVTALCPGVTDTEFFDAAGYRRLGKFMERRRPADLVAREGVDGLARGRMTVIAGFGNKFLVTAERFVPRRLVAAVSRRLMAGRRKK